jgi:hypothetical protein
MTAVHYPRTPVRGGCARTGSVLAVAVAGVLWLPTAHAMERFAPGSVSVPAQRAPVPAVTIPSLAGWHPVAEQGPRWLALTEAQRDALGPLEEDWPGIDAARKQKWLEIAMRFPAMSAGERQRLHERMAEWARLTPSQRGEARANFQKATRVVPQDRGLKWEAYKALPDAERNRLASQAAARPGPTPAPARSATGGAKSNIVPNPTFATAIRSVAPTVVRAGPGATTTLVTKRPSPPLHQHPGFPKVPAISVLVDQSTLLPHRGPQVAAQAIAPQTPTISGDGAPTE